MAPQPVRSISLMGTRRFSDADVERAQLLHHYPS
jgi:hypothetical protein